MENVRKILSHYPGATDVVLVVDSPEQSPPGSEYSSSDGPPATNGDGSTTAVAEPQTTTSTETGNQRIRYILTTGKDCQVTVGKEFQQALRDTIGDGFFELKAATSSNGGGGSTGR